MKTRFARLLAGASAVALAIAGVAAGQDAPRFVGFQSDSNGEMRLDVSAPSGRYCRLQLSTNVRQWDSFVTGLSTGRVTHTDSGSLFADTRFYRARQLTGTNIMTGDHLATADGDVVIHPIYHASIVLGWGNKTIYVDPGTNKFAGLPLADLILFTHGHADHFSASAVAGLLASNGVIVAPQSVYQSLAGAQQGVTTVLANGASTSAMGVGIEAIAMYNTNSVYHPRGDGNGYVLTAGGKRVYISGDTDNTPEVRALSDIEVAFVCMRPPYTMGVDDAAAAVRAFRPRVVYPYHYMGYDVGSFKQQVGTDLQIEVRLRPWY